MKKAVLLLVLVLAFSASSKAAIAFDNKIAFTGASNSSTASSSYTTAGVNRELCVGVAFFWGNNGPITVSSVTYGGVSVPVVQSINMASPGFSFLWGGCLAAPALGANTLTVTVSANPLSTWYISAVSYTGVNQSGLDSTGFNTSQSTSTYPATLSGNVTTVAANAWIVDVFWDVNGGGTSAPSAPQTQREPMNPGAGMSDNGPIVTPASTADSWVTSGGSGTTSQLLVAFSLAPFIGKGGSTDF